jgi:mannose-6-phosphate isomerase-like protein (cupin superfamily)
VAAARPDPHGQRPDAARATSRRRTSRRRGRGRRGQRTAAAARQRRRADVLCRRRRASPYYRNAIGDECLYIHGGTARVETVFGDLDVWEGDYVIIPRATTHRIVPTGEVPVRIYAIEVNSHITPPKRYLSRFGQFLEHAPFCERDLRVPTDPYVVEERDVPVYIKHRGAGTSTASRARSTSSRTTPSTSSAGTAACGPTPSTSATTSR